MLQDEIPSRICSSKTSKEVLDEAKNAEDPKMIEGRIRIVIVVVVVVVVGGGGGGGGVGVSCSLIFRHQEQLAADGIDEASIAEYGQGPSCTIEIMSLLRTYIYG